jgi:pyruvate dehydrogenase E2 component (dihydrolipoamide acetyltransferase)
MPSLGMYTTEGTVTDWLRPPGSQVTAGQPIIEVTTEKATYQVEAPVDGTFHPIVTIGTLLPDQGLIGYILAAGEEPPAAPVAASPAPAAVTPSPAAAPASPSTAPAESAGPAGGEVRASPVARRVARELGVDISRVVGTGPGGRIVEADIIAASKAAPAVAAAPSGPASRTVRERIPLIGMRKTIADRLRGSFSTTAPVTLTRDVDAEVLASVRDQIKDRFSTGLPYDALFVKVVARALAQHPEFNAAIEGDAIVQFADIHIGVAVAVSGGLLVPVVRDADRRSLAEVAADIVESSGRARTGQITPDAMAGGTFTITNLGAYGVDAFTPIINPPQAAILGIGRILPRAVVRDGGIYIRRTCTLSLTFDHRVADGAPAAQLLGAIVDQMADDAGLRALV